MNMVEITALFTAAICVVYAVFDGVRPFSMNVPTFFRSRSGALRIER